LGSSTDAAAPGTTPGELRSYLSSAGALADEYAAFFNDVAADPSSILLSATTTRLRAIGMKVRQLQAPPEFRETHRWFVSAAGHYDKAANCADKADLDCTIAEIRLGSADIDQAHAELLAAIERLGL